MVMVGCAAPLQTKNKLCEKTLCIYCELSILQILPYISTFKLFQKSHLVIEELKDQI